MSQIVYYPPYTGYLWLCGGDVDCDGATFFVHMSGVLRYLIWRKTEEAV